MRFILNLYYFGSYLLLFINNWSYFTITKAVMTHCSNYVVQLLDFKLRIARSSTMDTKFKTTNSAQDASIWVNHTQEVKKIKWEYYEQSKIEYSFNFFRLLHRKYRRDCWTCRSWNRSAFADICLYGFITAFEWGTVINHGIQLVLPAEGGKLNAGRCMHSTRFHYQHSHSKKKTRLTWHSGQMAVLWERRRELTGPSIRLLGRSVSFPKLVK